MDGAAEYGPSKRYAAISEFIHNLTHPKPLLDRNRAVFWRSVSIGPLLLCVLLLYVPLCWSAYPQTFAWSLHCKIAIADSRITCWFDPERNSAFLQIRLA